MTARRTKPKTKRLSQASRKRKSAPKAAKAAAPGANAKSPPNARANAKPQPIRQPADWRGQTLARMRALILEAVPAMTEDVKWRKPSNAMQGIPVWSHNGIVCTGERYKNVVKLTFARGASIPDPAHLFNSSLEGNTRRAIDIHEGQQVDAAAFQALVQAAVDQNGTPVKKARTSTKQATPLTRKR